MKHKRRGGGVWTPAHEGAARMLLRKGRDYDDIGARLGFSAEYVQRRMEPQHSAPGKMGVAGDIHTRPRVALLTKAAARREAQFRRDERGRAIGDVTAEFFGDHPAGRRSIAKA